MHRTAARVLTLCAALLAPAAALAGGGPDLTIPSVGLWFPDESGVKRWGTEEGVTAYSIAAFSCNTGTADLPWNGFTDQHPVLVQNLYRLENGKLEQIGASPAKHVTATVPQDLFCSDACNWPGSFILGVGCSDPYDADRNGQQDRIGPRYEINPSIGVVPYPFTGENVSGGVLDKRIRVRNDDLDPALHPGARYFVEGLYISEADTLAGNQYNNAGYREVQVADVGDGSFDLLPAGDPVGEATIIDAWAAANPAVTITAAQTLNGGRYILGSHATDNGDGTWRYEYALMNYNDHHAANGFSVPTGGCTPITPQFHAPTQDPIEQITGGAWDVSTGQTITWSTDPIAINPDANALRWGLTFTFRFDSACPPSVGNAVISHFDTTVQPTTPIYAVIPMDRSCPADIAPPAGVLDLADVQAFVAAFLAGDPIADFTGDAVLDLADLQLFVSSFTNGCP